MYLHVQLHHLVNIERVKCSRNGHAQRIANKVPAVMVVQELRIPLEDLAFIRLLNVILERYQPIFPPLIEQLKNHLQRRQIPYLVKLRSRKYPAERRYDSLQNSSWIGDQQCSNCSTGDDEKLCGLHQHPD